jgi:ferredoxin-NADP reductase
VSSFLHERVRAGSVIGLGAPAGDFVLDAPSGAGLLLLSGGSGATPGMAILRDLAGRGALHDVVVVQAARSAADVIFRDELLALAARHAKKGDLRVIFRLDDAAKGPLAEAELQELVPDFAARQTLLCGPPGMMDAMERIWTRAGARSRLRTERFVAARPPVTPVTKARGEAVTLRLSRSGRCVSAEAHTVLEQLEQAGERPAYGCRMGICQTCRCLKRAGTVEDLLTGAVSSEPDQEIRLCVSVARSDLDLAL